MNLLLDKAYGIRPEIIKWRRWIHENAEVGMELKKTSDYVESILDELNISNKRIGQFGIVGVIGEGMRTILLRADMDALPQYESTDLNYASKKKAMHACGHDIHTAMLLGAAKLLKEMENQLQGRVILMFQPGEECLLGAKTMIEGGLIDDYMPESAFTMHVNVDDVPKGDVWVKQSTFMASSDSFEVIVNGKGGHGAHPHNADNPIYAAIRIVDIFSHISRYEASPMKPNILTVCSIEAGDVANVIPDYCKFKGTLRAMESGERERIINRLLEASKEIATAYRCTAEMKIIAGVPCTTNDDSLSSWVVKNLSKLLGKERVSNPVMASMGSEDFAYISQIVPSCYMSIGTGRMGNGNFPLHNKKIIFDEGQMHIGSAVFTSIALDYFNEYEK